MAKKKSRKKNKGKYSKRKGYALSHPPSKKKKKSKGKKKGRHPSEKKSVKKASKKGRHPGKKKAKKKGKKGRHAKTYRGIIGGTYAHGTWDDYIAKTHTKKSRKKGKKKGRHMPWARCPRRNLPIMGGDKGMATHMRRQHRGRK